MRKDNFFLELWFDDGAHRLFDERPYLERGGLYRLKILIALDKFMSPTELFVGQVILILRRKRYMTTHFRSSDHLLQQRLYTHQSFEGGFTIANY